MQYFKRKIWYPFLNRLFKYLNDKSYVKNQDLQKIFRLPGNIRFISLEKNSDIHTFVGVSRKVKCYERTVICIKEGDKIYKVISISASKDGSLNIFFPYCKEKRAHIFQHTHKYKGGLSAIEKSQITKEYLINETTKLSIHKSGFVQLSGNNIKSGIDERTGEPKGVGVFSSPLETPVRSGPTFGFGCWGLNNGFELLDKRKENIQYIILEKERGNFIERKFNKEERLNQYDLEFFIFPKQANAYIYEYKNEPFINHIIGNYLHAPGTRFAHPVIDIKNFDGVIAVFPVLIWTRFADEAVTGFNLDSPGGSDNKANKFLTGNAFHIICPRVPGMIEKKDLPNLEFTD